MSESSVRSGTSRRSAPTARRIHLLGTALITALAAGLMLPVPSARATLPEAVQRGDDIDGEYTNDFSGTAVALSADGRVVAVGSSNNDDGGSNAGHVRVYRWSGGAWVQRGADIDGEAASDKSGVAVALSADGSTVAIGADWNRDAGNESGHVRVYRWSGGAWIQRGADIDGEAAVDHSGISVALSEDGSTVAVGATLNDDAGGDAGHVRVHVWNGSAWVQRGGDIDGEAAGDQAGVSVALSEDGSIVAVGASRNAGTGTNAGQVRVHVWDGSAWVQRGGDIDGEAAQDYSGKSVALSDDGLIVAVGAPYNDDGGSNAGQVRVHVWDGTSWVQRGGDIDGDAADEESGFSVALSGDGLTVVVGAITPVGGVLPGLVRVHVWDGTAWVQRGSDIDGEAAGDRSGVAVALSDDGLTFAVGASNNDGGGSNSGHVRVLSFSPDDEEPGAVTSAAVSSPSLSCVPSVPVAREIVTCTVTSGDPGLDILWRAAYNPVFAEAGVTLDASGSGAFSFTVPAAAVGQVLSVELVEWMAPVSLGVVGGPVPSSVPSGGGPVPVWPFALAALAGGGLLRRRVRPEV